MASQFQDLENEIFEKPEVLSLFIAFKTFFSSSIVAKLSEKP